MERVLDGTMNERMLRAKQGNPKQNNNKEMQTIESID